MRGAIVIGVVLIVACVSAVVGMRALGGGGDPLSRAVGGLVPSARPSFPAVDTTGLSPQRRRIIDVVRAQYARNAPGTTYSGGAEEPWCADFVSTVMRESGVPLNNPNSGSWRIPGVATLTDYLHSSGRWRGPAHHPQPGDIVVYDKPSPLGQHTNIVVSVDGDQVRTVGGNEADGITLRTAALATDPGLQGFGMPGAG
ncbi:CHAP domain-containing protein [Gordonia sp. DT30]|uniref:CHAP domain-containing protein n=1 Tax=unclassified Gordonia (in: high G+C Gram-positive bacteria) TaxID=2657482 RepID=UPI003CF8B724